MSDSALAHPSQYEPKLGDVVRFRIGKAPEILRGREDATGTVVKLVPRVGTHLWPVVEFAGYLSAELAPGQIEFVRRPDSR